MNKKKHLLAALIFHSFLCTTPLLLAQATPAPVHNSAYTNCFKYMKRVLGVEVPHIICDKTKKFSDSLKAVVIMMHKAIRTAKNRYSA